MPDIVPYLKIYNVESFAKLKEVNINEVKRYAGIISKCMPSLDEIEKSNASESDSIIALMHSCIEEAKPVFSYKVSYMRTPLSFEDGYPVLPMGVAKSEDLAKNLKGCSEVVLFAATVGIGIDRLIAKYNRVSPSKALFMQALGAERVEALCDTFNEEINELVKAENKITRPRFSPGYGDLSINIQKDFCSVLDCQRKLGITLSDSFLMSPSKSVTAIIGIKDSCSAHEEKVRAGCENCNKADCEFRK